MATSLVPFIDTDDVRFAEFDAATPEEREENILAYGRTTLQEIGDGKQLDRWLSLANVCLVLRRRAMVAAHAAKPIGKKYGQELGALYDRDPVLGKHRASLTHVMWLTDPDFPERLDLLQQARGNRVETRDEMASPKTARNAVQKLLNGLKRMEKKAQADPDAEPPESRTEKLAREKKELEAEVAELRERNTVLEGRGEGSGFDPITDSARDIAAVIGCWTHTRAKKARVKKTIELLQMWLDIPAAR